LIPFRPCQDRKKKAKRGRVADPSTSIPIDQHR
jgi:hypothetical protein